MTSFSFSKFQSIATQIKPLCLPKNKEYYAHINKVKSPERLQEHMDFTCEYALRLIDYHKLDIIVDRLICKSLPENFPEAMAIYVKKMFYAAILYHDYGKINENFQLKKMGNANFQSNYRNRIGTRHSILSAYLFLIEHFREIDENFPDNNSAKSFFCALAIFFAAPIFKHHSSHLNCNSNFGKRELNGMQDYPALMAMPVKQSYLRFLEEKSIKRLKSFFYQNYPKNDHFSLYALVKLNSSLLTASDYYATSAYALDLQIDKFGTLTREDVDCLYQKFWTYEYNEKLLNDFDAIRFYPLENLKTCNEANLNILRSKLLAEAISNVRENPSRKIFYLEAPTGAGKTNLSLGLALELLKSSESLDKIFYVFPYTTLVTQTFQSIKNTLGIGDDMIIQLHSKTGIPQSGEKEEEDAVYQNRRNYIDYLFVNFPITLLTHVKFFEILKSSSKNSNYLLHRLGNSVVIIDELQSYPPQEWDKICFFLVEYARSFNIKFLLMSATLPKLDKIRTVGISEAFTPLIADKNAYFQNPNFRDRVRFDFSWLKEEMDLASLEEKVHRVCEEYARQNSGNVKAIIQFITKKSAGRFHEQVKTLFSDYKLYLLSGSILEPRRREIIANLKKLPSDHQSPSDHKKILLISTQVVEAGVDIDMDIGFKDRSLIDNEEQLAGRVNREAAKPQATVYIFDFDKEHNVYGKDLRYKMMKEEAITSQYQRILTEKDFDCLYDMVCEYINRENRNELVVNLDEYKRYMRNLNFAKVDYEFQLIREGTQPVFVPLKVPVTVEGEEIFSEKERNFLKKFDAYCDETEVDGEKVWQAYRQIKISDEKKKEFIDRKMEFKQIAGIMSKFIFSVHGKQFLALREYADLDEGNDLLYLSHHNKIYDYHSGIKDEKFEETSFL